MHDPRTDLKGAGLMPRMGETSVRVSFAHSRVDRLTRRPGEDYGPGTQDGGRPRRHVALEEALLSKTVPSPLRRYLERTVREREQLPRRVLFTQVGEMQQRPGRWLAFQASEELAVDRVEFEWQARFPLAPLVSLQVRDWYRAGAGGLVGRLWGLVPVLRACGPELARGEAMRYLSELPWVPHAMIGNRELEWRALDHETVEVATGVGSARASVRLHVDAAGDVVGASAPARPRMVGRRTVATPWRGRFGDYALLGGLRVPTSAEAAWELPEGPFTYFRGRLTALELAP